MYQPGSECTCQSPSASKEQRKTTAHLPTVVKLLFSREEAHYSIHKTARSCFISTSKVEIKPQRRYMAYLQSQQMVAYSKSQKITFHPMLIPGNMLKYRIAAVFISMHNHSTSALLPRTIGKARYKLQPSLMEAQSHSQTEVVLFQTKKQLPDTWKLVSQNR